MAENEGILELIEYSARLGYFSALFGRRLTAFRKRLLVPSLGYKFCRTQYSLVIGYHR
jgi:hypothetical protein